MKQRKFGLLRGRRSVAKRRLRRTTWTIPNVSRKPWPSGEQSGSLIKQGSPLSVVHRSLTRVARRNSRSSSIKQFTSPSQTTRLGVLCGRHLLTRSAVSLRMTSHYLHWRISVRVTRLEALKRLVRTSWLSSAWKRWSKDRSHCLSLLDHCPCARRQWTTSMTNTASLRMTWLVIRSVVTKSKPLWRATKWARTRRLRKQRRRSDDLESKKTGCLMGDYFTQVTKTEIISRSTIKQWIPLTRFLVACTLCSPTVGAKTMALS